MPRFPSRDLADRFAGNRGYIHRPDRIRRARTWLALAGLSLSLGWAAFELLAPSRAAYVHTHGPLADPHAALEGTCAACHRGHRPDEFGPGSVFHARERWRDLTCEGCHAGPAHHARADAAGRAFHDGCGNCHHDHGGRANSLVRIGDEHCTNCHADLPAHTADGTTRFAPRVTNFATDHPEFRARREAGAKPPAGRALKFSHPLHLTPGLVGRDARGRPWTLARIADEPARARYRKPGQSDSDPVTLDCASCHRLDGAPPGEFPGGSLPVRAAGDYHLPVRFDAHCRACHPIRVPEASLPGTRIDGFPVPHGKQPGELRTILAGR